MTLNSAPVAHAATITADGTTCTLVDAITAANNDSTATAGSGDDTIQLASSGTVTLTSANEADPDGYGPVGLPSITSNITIEGNGTTITRSGGNNFRLFYVKSGASLSLENLTLSNGRAQGGNGGDGYEGGGGGALGAGGAIFNRGTLTTSRVTFTSNSAQGGNGGTVPGSLGDAGGGGGGMGGDGGSGNGTGGTGGNGGGINGGSGATGTSGTNGGIGGGGGGAELGTGANGGFGGGGGGANTGGSGGFGGGGGGSTNNNGSGGFGGGNGGKWGGGGGLGAGGAIFNDSGTINITNTTFSSNSAQGGNGGNGFEIGGDGGSGFGGALFNYNGTVTVNNATFASHTITAGSAGTGGLPSDGSVAGGGIYNYQESGTANLTLKNTILADTTSGTDCENNAGTVTAPAANTNLIESHTGCGTPAVTTDPNLAALADNGGDTETHALQVGSPAIDAGETANSRTMLATGCLASDGSTIASDQRNAPRAQGANNGDASCDIGAYEYNSTPLAVMLASLQALATGEHVVVTWQTVSELSNLGFNLYRAEVTATSEVPVTLGEQLNSNLIPAQAPGSGQGAVYEWVDEEVAAGVTYYYRLADVDVDGVETVHGPVSAIVNVPTAIRLDSFQSIAIWPLWALLSLCFALLVGAWRMLRHIT